jgi:mRNA interferase MazF
MKKNYKVWHPLKAEINNTEDKRPFFHEREIWFCHFGENVGYEQDGRGEEFLRPVIVFCKFNNEVFWAIPLTRTDKKLRFYFSFTFDRSGQSTAVLSQIRLLDARRLSYKTGEISEKDFSKLKKKFEALLP